MIARLLCALFALATPLLFAVQADADPTAPTSRPGGSARPTRLAPSTPRIKLAFTGDVAMNWRGTPTHWKVFPWRKNPLRFFAPVFKSADLAISNMEGVLMRRDPQYAEKRLNLWAPWASGQVFKPAGIGLVSTANNHAFDGRDVGVLETLKHLRKTGVEVMGTGRTMEQARAPYRLRHGASCVAFLPATTKSNKGVRGAARVAFYRKGHREELVERVRRTRAKCSFVVVYIHWGTEKAHVPGKKIRALAHALVDAGAGLVVGHHPHVLQGVEWRGDAPIVYSLGNFVFSNPTVETRRTGVLWVELTATAKPRIAKMGMIPAYIDRRDYTPRPARRPRAEDLLRRMQTYSRPFGTQVVLQGGQLRFLPKAAVTPP